MIILVVVFSGLNAARKTAESVRFIHEGVRSLMKYHASSKTTEEV